VNLRPELGTHEIEAWQACDVLGEEGNIWPRYVRWAEEIAA
jgi:hypothetical protein